MEFEGIKPLLEANVLYGGYGKNRLLKEIPFDKLEDYK